MHKFDREGDIYSDAGSFDRAFGVERTTRIREIAAVRFPRQHKRQPAPCVCFPEQEIRRVVRDLNPLTT